MAREMGNAIPKICRYPVWIFKSIAADYKNKKRIDADTEAYGNNFYAT